MTDIGAARPHVAAVQALLVAGIAGLGLDYQVYVSEVPPVTELAWPYLVLHPDPGVRSSTRLTADSDRYDSTIQVTCVGRDTTEALAAADTVCELLIDQRPVVAGRTCWRITQIPGTPPILVDRTTLDPATSRATFFVPIQLAVASIPG